MTIELHDGFSASGSGLLLPGDAHPFLFSVSPWFLALVSNLHDPRSLVAWVWFFSPPLLPLIQFPWPHGVLHPAVGPTEHLQSSQPRDPLAGLGLVVLWDHPPPRYALALREFHL